MKEFSKYVGMDVHKETIAVAVAEARGGEVRYLGEIANSVAALQFTVIIAGGLSSRPRHTRPGSAIVAGGARSGGTS